MDFENSSVYALTTTLYNVLMDGARRMLRPITYASQDFLDVH